jgi:hypothetical protein
LEPIPLGKEITGYRFPDLQSRDTSWIRAMDGLRPPRPREARKEDWRREQPLRPIMFEDPGNLDDKAVHIHLEHRVVQRLLGRFTSQGFVYHDLSRACIAQSEDAIPRVVLLARLSLYGKGSARLHEELVSVAARWIDPDRRKSKTLFPFGDAAEERALGLLEEGLLRPRQQHIPTQVQTRLRGSGPGDVDALLPSLTEKAEAAAEIAKRKLAARGEAEAKAMGEILAAQKERIRKQYDLGMRADSIQLDFFPEIEKRQFEANLRHWKARLGELDREIQAEPQRILEQYEILAQRIEPIGLAYLWPITG